MVVLPGDGQVDFTTRPAESEGPRRGGAAMSLPRGANGRARGEVPQAGAASRFEQRWHLVGAGLSNVWRFGDLELPAASGRLLLRGPNGTGKTTALEALAPYLLDLNSARMSAGKARTTNLSSLMREGATGKRRHGYAWLTLADAQEGIWSFGVRIQYSDGASPPIKVIPFRVPGRPLHELALHGPAHATLSAEEFAETVARCGGQIFESDDAYVTHLATRLFRTSESEVVTTLAQRLRAVRNPALLGDVSPQGAADALRASLPGVAEEVIHATADALAESDATRESFTRDKQAAEILDDLRSIWCAHATEVIARAHTIAAEAARDLHAQAARCKALASGLEKVSAKANEAKQRVNDLSSEIADARSELDALEQHQAYQDAGRLQDLTRTAAAQRDAADTAVRLMEQAARGAASECSTLLEELEALAQDLEEHHAEARNADGTIDTSARLLTWTTHARPLLRAGELEVDPGPELVVHGVPSTLREVAASWLQLAQAHEQRAKAAELAFIDHRPVEALRKEADTKANAAHAAAQHADRESAKAERAHAEARHAAAALLAEVGAWTHGNPQLTEPRDEGDGAPWSTDDVEQLAGAEPGRVLLSCDTWAEHAIARAGQISGEHRARAQQQRAEAATHRAEAKALRAEAESLRAGRLLPLPRPEWAGPGDDGAALGAILDWRADFDDPTQRALLEAAMAAAGLLGASLGESGASTRSWRVEATGPEVHPNLSEMVEVDAAHPLAPAAARVLARVRVAPTASQNTDLEPAGLCLGSDGTFRAGVLRGRVPGTDDPASFFSASHVGARQRRMAALARAAVLERQVTARESLAADLLASAAHLEQDAAAVAAAGRSFPPRERLRSLESRRATTAQSARDARDAATGAQTQAEHAADAHARAHTEWIERTRARGLPADLPQLENLRDRGARAAQQLQAAAAPLRGKLADRLERALTRHASLARRHDLAAAEAKAQTALGTHADLQAKVRVLEETAGAAIAKILARHAETRQRHENLRSQLGPAEDAKNAATEAQSNAQADLRQAETKLYEETQPKAARTLGALRALLGVPGVIEAVLDGEPPASGDALVEQVGGKLRGRKTLTVRNVLERVDTAKAKLAGIWSLDPDEAQGGLLTFVLTYRDETYTPVTAAAHAQELKAKAERALAASEERALQEFVIGRLPTAIGTAWTQLHDWITEVNRKMQSATASSGVGVQVRAPRRHDLAPALQEVHELACKVSAADRTPEQRQRLGDALYALLGAAQGETMQQRVASAVDIRDWVEVYYEVTRPGGTKQRWSSKTGLSGGERRLVVIAPMLAAIAASYDRLGPKALRLVTLDEVPAEVDEQGREGLARYIAELDLDLICTSYLWDGCPGAWDGIDAHDLEAGPDGTVVAFPMLVRGLAPIPEPGASPPPHGSPEHPG
jgi:DNA polymerase III delta prime subunit